MKDLFMTVDINVSRRLVLASGVVLGASTLIPRAFAVEPIKVAGIHGSPVENAWNSVLHKALQDAAAEGKIEYAFSEGVAGTDYPRVMSEYAEQGVKLVIGETFPVEKQARTVAADYPETAFVMGSSGQFSGANFGTFGTWNYDGAYLAGMLAGKMTKTNVVASVGAIPIPEINLLINAFAAGVKAVNPDAKHLVGFIGTFFDPPKAREAGLAQIELDRKPSYIDEMVRTVEDPAFLTWIAQLPEGARPSDFVVSLGISATKPGGEACCTPSCCG